MSGKPHLSPKTDGRIDPYLWLTLLLSIPVLGPLLQPGYFWGAHDARHSVYFLQQFNIAMQDGIWYPRWAPDFAFGYGYPFFNIYGPMSSYFGATFHMLGLDLVAAVKATFGLSAILSGLAMYLFVRRMAGPASGLIAALVYVYLPYHLFDLYVRAALAESVSFIFIPLTLWAFYEAMAAPHLKAIAWGAVAYACLMFSHPPTAIIITLIAGGYVAFSLLWQWLDGATGSTEWFYQPFGRWLARPGWTIPRNRRIATIIMGIPPLVVFGLGLGLSAISFFPAVLEAGFVRTDQWFSGRFAFGDDFVEMFQLFSPQWGFGASIPGPDDEAGFQIGLAATVLYIVSFLTVPRLVNAHLRRTIRFYQVTALVVAFLTVPLSTPLWQLLPLTQLVQFPWRLLVIVAPFISIVAGMVLAGGERVGQKINGDAKPDFLPLLTLAALILLSSYPYIQAEVRDPQPTEGPVSQMALFSFQQSADELTGQTAWVRRIPNWSTLAEQIKRGGQIATKVNYPALPPDDSVGVFSMEMDSVHELLWVGTEKEGQMVPFFIPYYPGWQAYIYEDLGPHDGNLDKNVGPVTRIGPVIARPAIQTTPIEGWMIVPIPKGAHFLELRFEDTLIRQIGEGVSAVTLIAVVVLLSWPTYSAFLNRNRDRSGQF